VVDDAAARRHGEQNPFFAVSFLMYKQGTICSQR